MCGGGQCTRRAVDAGYLVPRLNQLARNLSILSIPHRKGSHSLAAHLASPAAALRRTPTANSSSSRTFQLRHVFGVETKGAKPVFNLSPLLTSLDGPILAASSSFWAVPWVGGGGPVYVSPMCAAGKVGMPVALLVGVLPFFFCKP